MRALIFGCGYLGHRVASAWIENGNEVFAVTRSEQKSHQFRTSGIQPIIADLCQRQSLVNLPHVDVVLHCVGFDHSSGSSHEDVTCGGLRNVLDVVTGRCARLIYISSTSVYGQSSGEWVDETSECAPTSSGGMLCLQAEQQVRDWAEGHQTASTNILRLAGIYGPGRLLSRIDALKSGLVLAGHGDAFLNLIHVDDAVTAIEACQNQQIDKNDLLIALAQRSFTGPIPADEATPAPAPGN